jgi:hypothetical protein
MPICDGCGAAVDAEHIRARIMRLELATRFRPVHIQTLLVGVAPPERAEDYFYASEKGASELQKNGIFLVYAVECPLPAADASEAVRRAVATVVKRVHLSYKPKAVVLFGAATGELIEPLRAAGLGDRLVLSGIAPFAELPDLAKFRTAAGA